MVCTPFVFVPLNFRRFNTVDKNWREIMKATLEDRHVLAVIEIENLLDTLKTSNELLDLIQKVKLKITIK